MKNYILLNLGEYKPTHVCIKWIMHMLLTLRGDDQKKELAQMIDSWLDNIETCTEDWEIYKNVLDGIVQFLLNGDTTIWFNKTAIRDVLPSSSDYKYMKFRYNEKIPEHERLFMVNLTNPSQIRRISFQYKDQIIKVDDIGG